MTIEEFSEGFDTLLSNHTGVIALDEYEKSLFLTLAQEAVVKDFYNGSKPYELTEESRRALSQLTTTIPITLDKVDCEDINTKNNYLLGDTYRAILPKDLFFIVYEQATIDQEEDICLKGKHIPVVPTSADVFYKVNENPFRGPSKSRALRLDVNEGVVEIISKYKLSEYKIRYVRKPHPIMLVDLTNTGLTINGYSKYKTLKEIKKSGDSVEEVEIPVGCELEESTHLVILMKAVELAVSLRTPSSSEPKQKQE